MRYAAFVVAAALMLIQPAQAGKTPEVDPSASLGVVQRWIYNYRAKPDYAHVPAAVRVLFHSQTFKEPENAGIYLGFVAGAIGSNPAKAEQLIASFFPVRPEDEWVIVRAIAYSGLPDWRNVLRRVAPRIPGRRVMIDAYLAGKLPTLTEIPLEEAKPGMMDKLLGKKITVPEGTVLNARLDQSLSSKTNSAGDEFTATIDREVVVDGKTRGVSPPVRALDLSPGAHTIEIKNANFPVYVERVELKAGEAHKIRHRFGR